MKELKAKDSYSPGKFGGGTVCVGGLGGGFRGNVLGGDAKGANQENLKCYQNIMKNTNLGQRRF